MKIEQYIKYLEVIAKKHPGIEVIALKDGDDGGEANEPALVNYEANSVLFDDGTDEWAQEFKINAVCVH